jgi:hypothetical protein
MIDCLFYCIFFGKEARTFQGVLFKDPKGPDEPALGFFKKKPDFPTLVGNNQQNNKSFRPTSPGVARTFTILRYYYYVDVRFRLRYVNVAGVTFSFTLRSRAGVFFGKEARTFQGCNFNFKSLGGMHCSKAFAT